MPSGPRPTTAAPAERLAVSPVRRTLPPWQFAGLDAEHVLTGHGAGVHGLAARATLDNAIAHARPRTPAWLPGQIRCRLGRRRGR